MGRKTRGLPDLTIIWGSPDVDLLTIWKSVAGAFSHLRCCGLVQPSRILKKSNVS